MKTTLETLAQDAYNARTAKPAPVVQAGYLPATTWSRDALAERLRYWRAQGFIVARERAGRYWVAPYMIDTRGGAA